MDNETKLRPRDLHLAMIGDEIKFLIVNKDKSKAKTISDDREYKLVDNQIQEYYYFKEYNTLKELANLAESITLGELMEEVYKEFKIYQKLYLLDDVNSREDRIIHFSKPINTSIIYLIITINLTNNIFCNHYDLNFFWFILTSFINCIV